MESKKSGKGIVLLAGAALATVGIIAATRSIHAETEGGNAVTLQILDSHGNPVPYTRGPSARGPVASGASLSLIPGSYQAHVTIKNTTTIDDVAGPATFGIVLSSTISGLISANQTVAFTAGETKAINYPFTVTLAMIGSSGTITVNVTSPTGTLLATDYATVACKGQAIALGNLEAESFSSTSGGTVMPGNVLKCKTGDTFYAELAFTYQYAGGNYTFLSECHVGTNYWRSYEDVILTDSYSQPVTVNVTTKNQDLFNSAGLTFGQTFDIVLSLVDRGADGTGWTVVKQRTYSAAGVNIVSDLTNNPMVLSAQIPASGTYGGSFTPVIVTKSQYIGTDPGYVTKITKTTPAGVSTSSTAASSSPSTATSGLGITKTLSETYAAVSLSESGTYTFKVDITKSGNVVSTYTYNVTVEAPALTYKITQYEYSPDNGTTWGKLTDGMTVPRSTSPSIRVTVNYDWLTSGGAPTALLTMTNATGTPSSSGTSAPHANGTTTTATRYTWDAAKLQNLVVSGTYNLAASLYINSVVKVTAAMSIVVTPNIIYGATVTIS